jgi:uncharacterized tellurite resistance protein B-like protein
MENPLNEPRYVYADILIALAQVDEHVDDRERELLDGIFSEMGLDGELVAEMWLTPRTIDVVESILGTVTDAAFKHCLLKDCYLLAYADERVEPAEHKMISRISALLNVDNATVNAIHHWVQTAISQRSKASELFGAGIS